MGASSSNGRKNFNEVQQGLHVLLEPNLVRDHRICFKHDLVTQQSKDSERNNHSQFVAKDVLEEPHQASKRVSHLCDDDATEGREACLEPKHNIFLSHSGRQKNFTEQLCKDLERVGYCPFFDKRPDSLRKGEKFPPPLVEAAQRCRVAVLVLSEDFFTRSKWPMIELTEFVRAEASTNPGLKLLPLFFGTTVRELKDPEKRTQWRQKWEEWASSDGKINVEEWVKALSKVLGPWNGMEYDERGGEVRYREEVVAAICKLGPADVKYDVAHVQSLRKLCEPISEKLDEEVRRKSRYGVRVVGLFGMGGVGKTTISKVMCNHYFGDFNGKVCHVELGGNNLGELRKNVLEELTRADRHNLPDDLDKLGGLLKSRMPHHKVFLSVDNVWEDGLEEARMYLELGYQCGSKVLVTSRSVGVLESLKLSAKEDCVEMPELEEESATKLFLHHVGCGHESFDEERWNIIRRCVEACRLHKAYVGDSRNEISSEGKREECESRMKQYLPLALKVWGIQLGHMSEDPLRWEESLRNLGDHKFNPSRKQDHPLFSVLRQGYDALALQEQQVFMDLAFFVPRRFGWRAKTNIVEWLSIIYKCSKDAIVGSLNALKRMALLEYSLHEYDLVFKIHDLYLEFAEEEAQVGALEGRRIMYNSNGIDVPYELLKRPVGGFWPHLERLQIRNSGAKSLKRANFHLCSNVEVLQLYDCEQLVDVDLRGMDCLISLDISGCEQLGDGLEGVEKLTNLAWFQWLDIPHSASFLSKDLSLLTALQVLHLRFLLSRMISTLDLSGCINLQEVRIWAGCQVARFPDLSNLSKLLEVSLTGFENERTLFDLSSLVAIEVVNFSYCRALCDLGDLCKFRHLRSLFLAFTGIKSLIGLEYATSLRHLDVSACCALGELPDLNDFKDLEKVDLSHSGVSFLPNGFERLARCRGLRMRGCWRLFEPLVVWLLEQQQRILEGSHGQSLISGSCSEVTMEQRTWVNIRKDAAHYLDCIFCADSYFLKDEFLSAPNLLEEVEGGIESVIRALCDYDDMGILSMTLAKYAATGKFWAELTAESTIQQLSNHVVQFLENQIVSLVHSMSAAERWKAYVILGGIEFILVNLTKNDVMATALTPLVSSQFLPKTSENQPLTNARQITRLIRNHVLGYVTVGSST